jgi:asparagine synthase (glutamine-hydrolysing)
MCGIAGVITVRSAEAYRTSIARIVASQHRRGPDFNAVDVLQGQRAGAVLGHNRLSIIDLSEIGNQPMWDCDRRVCIVFNGEIYNYLELRSELLALGHRFVSHSDTEVILEAFKQWGTEAYERFNGMFAFALFDTRDEQTYFVRDRFGVKPLYYAPRGDTVFFASTGGEMSRLLNLKPDLDYVSRGIRYGLYEYEDVAPYIGMKALLPGHWMQVGPDASGTLIARLSPYYDFHARTALLVDALASMPIERLVETAAALLEDSVRIRLRSDVPVAVSLSGGLDSSAVAALAARRPQGGLHGFTFGDPSVPTSEGPLAAQLARMAQIDITYVWPDLDAICETYQRCLETQAGPFPGGSIIAQNLVFKAARSTGFKVLLGGQGGDEAFMGYRKFQLFKLRHLMARKRHFDALSFAVTLLPTFFAERWRWLDSWRNRNRYGKAKGLSTVLRLPEVELEIGYSPTDPLRDRQILDVSLASLPTLLRYEDSNSMGNSIESRLPFLDYRVMEFGIALPDALKLRGGHGKWIVRQALTGQIPDDIRIARYKKGFNVQQGQWIDCGLGDRIRTMLHAQAGQLNDYLVRDTFFDDVFSNNQLKNRPSAFAEATTLLWLALVPSRM